MQPYYSLIIDSCEFYLKKKIKAYPGLKNSFRDKIQDKKEHPDRVPFLSGKTRDFPICG